MPRRKLEDVLGEEDPLLNVIAPVAKAATNEGQRVARKLGAFVERHNRLPRDDGEHGLEERLLAAEVGRLGDDPAVAPLLSSAASAPQSLDDILDSEMLTGDEDIFKLVHVPSRQAHEQPDYVGSRKPCADFASFKPLFDRVVQELQDGTRRAVPFAKEQEIAPGQFFIQKGMLAYVAEAGEATQDRLGNTNRRLRVIYDNGTEGDPLLRSFSSKLYGANGRRITEPDAGPLFSDDPDVADNGSRTGTIYVARSLSDHPEVVRHAGRLHKIGVTRGSAPERLQAVEQDPTFLMAPAALVVSFELHNVNPTRLERLLHKFFEPARADAAIADRFGRHVRPREWFFVPADAVREVVALIRAGTLSRHYFDPATGTVRERESHLGDEG